MTHPDRGVWAGRACAEGARRRTTVLLVSGDGQGSTPIGQWSSPRGRGARKCSRTGCGHAAVATLTYVYSDSTAVVGPLATSAEPHSYDLCERHAVRLTAPRGWEVVRYEGDYPSEPSADDLTALAEAVREAGRAELPTTRAITATTGAGAGLGAPSAGTGRRGHLRVLPDPSA